MMAIFLAQGFHHELAHHGALLGVGGHRAEGGLEALLGEGRGGGHGHLRDASVRVDLGSGDGGAELKRPMMPFTLASTNFCATWVAVFRVDIVFASSSNFTSLPSIDRLFGVGVFDGQGYAILYSSPHMRLRAGQRAAKPSLTTIASSSQPGPRPGRQASAGNTFPLPQAAMDRAATAAL